MTVFLIGYFLLGFFMGGLFLGVNNEWDAFVFGSIPVVIILWPVFFIVLLYEFVA